ncbi:carbohydrate ABC transporter permease [Jonesiaceae bacterium BS-20]|uniref:Carbohydrate ABC transporter permease n=1 Tax=Jonesiaceae bacterium BS-20 TaxID=3120821 RepID=A0AAU7DTL1_9MICO
MSKAKEKALIIYLVLASLLVGVPIFYAIFGAIRPGPAVTGSLWDLLPSGFSLEHFEDALRRAPLVQQMANSTIVTIAQTLAQVVTGVLAAYALVFGRLKRPNLIFWVFMVTMMIPGETILVANYLTIRSWGLFDTLAAVFLPFMFAAYNVFLMRQAFMSFPKEIHEAASIDGCGPVRFLGKFLLPLTAPTVVTVSLMSAIAAWNGYLWPLIVSESASTRTVQVGIKALSDEAATDIGASLAGITFATIPMIILVIIGQKFLVRGLTQGAGK